MSALPFDIGVEELAGWRAEDPGLAVLDVREAWERDIARLPGTIDIPMNEVPARIGELPRDARLAVLCHHGGRSAQVALWLRRQGFDQAVNVAGGIHAWAQRIDPAVALY